MSQSIKAYGASALATILVAGLTACGSSSSSAPAGSLAVTASPSSFTIQASGASVQVAAVLSRTNTQDAATLAVTGLPAGLTRGDHAAGHGQQRHHHLLRGFFSRRRYLSADDRGIDRNALRFCYSFGYGAGLYCTKSHTRRAHSDHFAGWHDGGGLVRGDPTQRATPQPSR